MTANDIVEAPSRRRRHARLIAALTELVGSCANAAAGVYGPIAEAPPGQRNVPVNLWPLTGLAMFAGERLDTARAEDAQRWPGEVERETREARQTFAARCAAAEAERILSEANEEVDDESWFGAVPLPSPAQLAAMGAIGAGTDFLEALDSSPEEALALLRELSATGEYTAGQILDEATDASVLAGLLTLRGASRESDPSMAAEWCLAAARQFALTVAVASADPED
ncbi:hypothetical protein ACFYUJ_38955 [Streptomyces sp. NPDC004520]|uniref:hypothetical protein n=1 Tax=Streptomyces sp. NPDC004520 TaxID=3364702 RepID=UPI0036D1E8FC